MGLLTAGSVWWGEAQEDRDAAREPSIWEPEDLGPLRIRSADRTWEAFARVTLSGMYTCGCEVVICHRTFFRLWRSCDVALDVTPVGKGCFLDCPDPVWSAPRQLRWSSYTFDVESKVVTGGPAPEHHDCTVYSPDGYLLIPRRSCAGPGL